MTRIALCAAVLLAGSLYPLVRLNPWKFHAERQALVETVRRYPKLRLVKLETSDPHRNSLRITLEMDPLDIATLTAFRRDVKTHSQLAKTFDIPIFEISCVWRVAVPEGAPDPYEFSVLFPSRGR